MSTQTDIAIIGGGLSGGLAALALAKMGLRCALIDAAPSTAHQDPTRDGRTSAISFACIRMFKRLGLWDTLNDKAEPIRDILVSDGRAPSPQRNGMVGDGVLHFDSRELSEHPEDTTALGWIVENTDMRVAFYEAIANHDSITLYAPDKLVNFESDMSGVDINLASGEKIRAQLLVGADGRFSTVRGLAKIKSVRWGYDQMGLVTCVSHERPHQGVAHELFLPGGPFAILPMRDNRASIVWTEKADKARAINALSDAEYEALLNDRFGPFLGACKLDAPRFSYPLGLHLAHSFVATRVALIGDAAHAIHPIAGQGFNLGIKDIAALADTLGQARDVGLDIGAAHVLAKYQQWRRFDSAMISLSADVINRLFSNDIAPLRALRDIGLSLAGKNKQMRGFFMREAGADIGDLPSLMAQ